MRSFLGAWATLVLVGLPACAGPQQSECTGGTYLVENVCRIIPTCGPGTVLQGTECVIADAGDDADASDAEDADAAESGCSEAGCDAADAETSD